MHTEEQQKTRLLLPEVLETHYNYRKILILSWETAGEMIGSGVREAGASGGGHARRQPR